MGRVQNIVGQVLGSGLKFFERGPQSHCWPIWAWLGAGPIRAGTKLFGDSSENVIFGAKVFQKRFLTIKFEQTIVLNLFDSNNFAPTIFVFDWLQFKFCVK